MNQAAQIISGFLPVVVFLSALIILDSYKLVKLKDIGLAIAVGGACALAALYCNRMIVASGVVELNQLRGFIAPAVEETLKALLIIYLIRVAKIGFMVDAAIFGFAVGAGFALGENVYYVQNVADSGIALWIVRGFGTAVMHGGATAIFAVISKELFDSSSFKKVPFAFPGLFLAWALHSIYNHFILPPLISTAIIIVVQPLIFVVVFHISEKALQKWLGIGLEAEFELHDIISSGQFSQTNAGEYLLGLRDKFSGPVVADMLCYLSIHLELGLAAKGLLLGRQGGQEIEIDETIRAQFVELEFLEKSIGATGMVAIAPLVKVGDRDKWQIDLLRD